MRRLRTGKLTALKKASGKPRCIAIREVLMNLAYASLVRQARDKIVKTLNDHDVGFGRPDSCAFPIHMLQGRVDRACQNNRTILTLILDVTNAYGTTSRQAGLDLLLEKLPQLVRPFLVAYEDASWLRQSGLADVKVDEGLLQGDPAAPAFAQLVYGNCCNTVRDGIPTLDLLLSFFDDLAISDEPGTALAALEKLVKALESAGLKVNLSKSVAYVTNPGGLSTITAAGSKSSAFQSKTEEQSTLALHLVRRSSFASFSARKLTECAGCSRSSRSTMLYLGSNPAWPTHRASTQWRRAALRHLIRAIEPPPHC